MGRRMTARPGRGPLLAIVLLLTAGLVTATWWSRRSPAGPVNVVLITLDTVRADHLGAYGFAGAKTPNLDALAASGARFDDAVSSSPITGPAHAGILTGRYPARFGVRDNATTPLPESATTLAEVLHAGGYDTGGFIGAFILDRAYGFAQGFETFDGFARVDSGNEANAERRGSDVMDAALAWLSSRPADRPFFLWVHLYDPHLPYASPAPYSEAFSDRPYDGEIAYTDAQVGRLIGALQQRDGGDRTMIMALADHGESLGEHQEADHGVFVYEPVIRVPWIVAGPGVRGGTTINEQVRSIDLAPTLLNAVGVATPDGLDGVSLLPLLRGETRTAPPTAYAESYYARFHYGWSELRAVRADGWKAIDAPRPELYNLRQDPGELRNLYEAQRSVADRMIAEASRMEQELTRDATGGGPVVPAQPDAETLQRLRSLGYVGSAAAAIPAGERGPDPKDHIAAQRQFESAMSEAVRDLRERRTAAAADKFRRLAAINHSSYDLHQFLGEAYQTLGRLPEALGEYEYAALLNPRATAPLLSAAEVHLAMGQLPRARQRFEQSALIAPGSFDVSVVSGRLLEAEGRLAESLAAYEQAIRQNGANPRPRMLLVGVASRLQRYDLAEEQLNALLRMQYQPSRTHFALGRLAQLRGRLDEAAQHYREALRLEPGLSMAAEGLRQVGRD
jgi:arylsulfatase A-like enzyme/Tfp pilus assembly protein PilF